MLGCGTAIAQNDKPARPPELSLETLFHPEKKHAFVSKLPVTRWLIGPASNETASNETATNETAGTPTPELLIRRQEAWNRLDLATGIESDWPVFEQLKKQLSALEGLQEGQSRSGAIAAVGQMKRADDSVLVRIGESLAIVSAANPARWLTRDAKNWRNATLDPLRRLVAYNNEGDLFLRDVARGRTLRLTRDGTETLLDGILDWTYQEEIFGRGNFKGFWFSPDGQWLAMLRIDISGIEPYTLPSTSSDRGKGVVSRYPKAGDPIPHASLLLWDLRQVDTGVVPPPKVLAQSTPQQERIVTGVWWHAHHRALLYCVSDRRQTWRELRMAGEGLFGNAAEQPSLLLREESPTWVEPPEAPGFLSDGGIVWRSELPSGRNRLYHIVPGGAIVTPITPESFDVQDFTVRADGSFVIVTGDAGGDTTSRHAYRIDLTNKSLPQLLPITSRRGWHDTKTSPDGEFITDVFSTESQPPKLFVGATARSNPEESPFKQIEEAKMTLGSSIITPQIFRIATGDDGIELPAMIVRPKQASPQKRCPVVIEVYGGPQAPVVSSRFGGNRTLYRELLARAGIATLVVDNRSSAGRGIADTWAVRGKFGEVELKDLLTAVKWLEDQPWVDGDRVAVRGWSFGGFLTLYAMTHSEAFAAGIAGGSVSDWREYDAFYTERYMDLPSRNPQGYESTSPLAKAANLHGRVLLIHGEADDNVHPTGTMRMADALQKAGKDFDLMIYPGAAHAIRRPSQIWHMSQMTDRFLRQQLLGNDRK